MVAQFGDCRVSHHYGGRKEGENPLLTTSPPRAGVIRWAQDLSPISSRAGFALELQGILMVFWRKGALCWERLYTILYVLVRSFRTNPRKVKKLQCW